jgi:DNA-binding winged helix-turn-helix (wHTH) protein
MRVNSDFTSFFTHRCVVRCSMAIVMIFWMSEVSATGSRCDKTPFHKTQSPESEIPGHDRDLRVKQVNIILRLIGHQLLLQAGDSTSSVLPITEVKEGTFHLQLQNQFFFSHDSIMALSQRLLPKSRFPSGYTVTVHDCLKAAIVYGFQINHASPDILPCSGRRQPPGCYIIEFTFPDFYEKVEPKKADIAMVTKERKSIKGDHPVETNVKPEEAETTKFISDATLVKDSSVDGKEVNPNDEELRTATFNYSFINLVVTGMLLSLGVTLLIARFGKSSTPVAVQNQGEAVINHFNSELTTLGQFSFDVKGQRLLVGTEVISLTDKECKILGLLNSAFGELIPRETLMQKVWINEGVITGRSLDMFVSKLRKKLSSDPDLRITNVHGKGYKLETPPK